MKEEEPKPVDVWWGTFTVAHHSTARWQIGPLSLWVERLTNEWRVARSSGDDPSESRVELDLPAASEDLLTFKSVSRYALSDHSERLELSPALADRPVVSFPERPLYVPASDKVTLYVGNPLWLQLRANSKLLDDFPIHPQSDTWFGPSPQHGELCFASRSFCRLELGDLPRRPHRSTTAVLVENLTSQALLIEQMRLPVPMLSLFHASDADSLWTEDVSLKLTDTTEMAPLTIQKGPPASLTNARRVSEPRHAAESNLMFRAFSSFLSG